MKLINTSAFGFYFQIVFPLLLIMKILTWNINGIRAAKRNLKDLFDSLDADIICLQETKVTRMPKFKKKRGIRV